MLPAIFDRMNADAVDEPVETVKDQVGCLESSVSKQTVRTEDRPPKRQNSYSYQEHWGERFQWLEYRPEVDKAFRSVCSWFSLSGKKWRAKNTREAFTI